MLYLDIIKKILNWIKNNQKIFLIAISAILLFLLIQQCQGRKYDNVKYKQNIKAANDSIEYYQSKNGDLVAEKTVWILSEKELREKNKELYKELKNIKNKGEEIVFIEVPKIVYRDTNISVQNNISKLNDTTYSLNFDYNKDGLRLKTKNKFFAHTQEDKLNPERVKLIINSGESVIETIELNMEMVLGLKEKKDGTLSFFLNTKDDKIKVTNLNGAMIEDYFSKKNNNTSKDWGISVTAGPGVLIAPNGSPYVGFGINMGLSKKIFNF